ncbi:camphor resistance protein CrcB [Halothiobacillus diazotrophicus]|uniref:Fluoride-specific ion channel FluC n=1 Tax=Halothiobacillus diazotrophicus TaxID=1860122 RepID=A0A191ZEY1_9GAMM|nr:fluoride efflux transporter CrcB [Halothiobacillus diazotrophicus]ANJ66429.1 camphor resistance protein CrcB [Halothiobacillus diazotrophicus]
MRLYALLALAGALGAMARYGVTVFMAHHFGRQYPWGTLTVNILGSALMGFLGIYLLTKLQMPTEYRVAILTGFLGAFTTMSTFSIDSLTLFERHQWWVSGLYITVTITACLAAARGGMLLAERI